MKSTLKSNPIVVVGSIAMDSVKTAYGEVNNALGGSATYFTLVAKLFAPVQVVGVIGEDFPKEYLNFLKNNCVDLEGVVKAPGKTFRWKGFYDNPNEAITLDTQLNVFERFSPHLPSSYRKSSYIFLANIHPLLQESVLSQIKKNAFVACDTMNHWIGSNRKELLNLYRRVKVAFLNEGEAKLLTGENHVVKAVKQIHELGPQWVIVKKGEHGVLVYDGKEFIVQPAYPVEDVVDPTGAGDSFAGGFMGYIASQGNFTRSTILKALAYGTIMASFAVEDFSVHRVLKVNKKMIRDRFSRYLKVIGRI
jgi:sugar/nucleoside kinase (ribokinase family)